jgi:hypothetical protein
MEATLVVSDRGAPSTAPAPAPPADTAAPGIRSSLARTSLRGALRRGRLTALITSDERVSLRLSLVTRLRGRTASLGRADTVDTQPGRSLRVPIALSRAGRRALRGRRRATVALLVEARDEAGNLSVDRASRDLRR